MRRALREEIDARVAELAAAERFPAIAAGIVVDGALAHRAAAGPADARTLFQIGSISKTFTAAAVLQLRDRGRLALDDPVVRHLPEFGAVRDPFGPVEAVTLRRLLLHTSGLQSEPTLEDPRAAPYVTQAEVVASLPRATIRIPPDSAFKYSNLGYRVLAEVVARVAGRPFAEHLQGEVIGRLGLAGTSATAPAGPLAERCAPGHGAGLEPRAAVDSQLMDGDGGLWSCVKDLAVWIAEQLGAERVLPAATVAEMQRPAFPADERWRAARTLGWQAVRRGSGVLVGHSGLVEGFDCYLGFSVPRRVGAIVLTNGLGRTGSEHLAWSLLDLVLAERAAQRPAARAAAEPAADARRDLVGRYASAYARTVHVEARDGALVRGAARLEPTSDPLRFALPWPDGEEVRFWRDGNGRIGGFNEGGDPYVRVDGPEPRPAAKVVPHATVVHGERIMDEYAWLRDLDGDPDVRAYLDAENRYADRALAHLGPLCERLAGELERWEGGPSPAGVLDLDRLAAGHAFARARHVTRSDDGRYVAYGLDLLGDEHYALGVLDLHGGEALVEDGPKVTSLAWVAGGLLYVEAATAPRRGHRLWRLEVPGGVRALLHEETDRAHDLAVRRSASGRYVFLEVTRYADAPHGSMEVRYAAADGPCTDWRALIGRCDGVEGHAEHAGEHFYLQAGDRGPYGRVVRLPEWEEVLPHRDGVALGRILAFRDHLVVLERRDGVPAAEVIDRATGVTHRVPLPPGPLALRPGASDYEAGALRYERSSLLEPPATVEYDLAARTETVLEQLAVDGYDPDRFEAVRLHARAADGTPIPIDAVRLRERAADPRRAVVLEGYGCYGGSSDPAFDASRLCLLERGVAVAIAHPRGGGELGAPWHDAGRRLAKRTTFADFVAAAEHLVAAGWAPPGRVVIRGISAGGALVTAAAHLRPDLFTAVVALVPFADPLHVQLDDTMPFTLHERPEWGDPWASREELDYLRGYCPYTTLGPQAYPAMYVTASLHDGQVPYWQPARYVARLRRVGTGTEPAILRTNLEAGHHGSSQPGRARRERAEELAFVLDRLGLA